MEKVLDFLKQKFPKEFKDSKPAGFTLSIKSLTSLLQGYHDTVDKERRGLYVNRSTYQETVEQKKKLLLDIQLLCGEKQPDSSQYELIREEIKKKYLDQFREERELQLYIQELFTAGRPQKTISFPTAPEPEPVLKPIFAQLVETEYIYQQISVVREPRDLSDICNEMSKEGWEFVQYIPIRSVIIFRKVVEKEPGLFADFDAVKTLSRILEMTELEFVHLIEDGMNRRSEYRVKPSWRTFLKTMKSYFFST